MPIDDRLKDSRISAKAQVSGPTMGLGGVRRPYVIRDTGLERLARNIGVLGQTAGSAWEDSKKSAKAAAESGFYQGRSSEDIEAEQGPLLANVVSNAFDRLEGIQEADAEFAQFNPVAAASELKLYDMARDMSPAEQAADNYQKSIASSIEARGLQGEAASAFALSLANKQSQVLNSVGREYSKIKKVNWADSFSIDVLSTVSNNAVLDQNGRPTDIHQRLQRMARLHKEVGEAAGISIQKSDISTNLMDGLKAQEETILLNEDLPAWREFRKAVGPVLNDRDLLTVKDSTSIRNSWVETSNRFERIAETRARATEISDRELKLSYERGVRFYNQYGFLPPNLQEQYESPQAFLNEAWVTSGVSADDPEYSLSEFEAPVSTMNAIMDAIRFNQPIDLTGSSLDERFLEDERGVFILRDLGYLSTAQVEQALNAFKNRQKNTYERHTRTINSEVKHLEGALKIRNNAGDFYQTMFAGKTLTPDSKARTEIAVSDLREHAGDYLDQNPTASDKDVREYLKKVREEIQNRLLESSPIVTLGSGPVRAIKYRPYPYVRNNLGVAVDSDLLRAVDYKQQTMETLEQSPEDVSKAQILFDGYISEKPLRSSSVPKSESSSVPKSEFVPPQTLPTIRPPLSIDFTNLPVFREDEWNLTEERLFELDTSISESLQRLVDQDEAYLQSWVPDSERPFEYLVNRAQERVKRINRQIAARRLVESSVKDRQRITNELKRQKKIKAAGEVARSMDQPFSIFTGEPESEMLLDVNENEWSGVDLSE